jgi:CAAX prenyl protease-like protein
LGLPAFHNLKLSPGSWNPHEAFGAGSSLATFFVVARIAGSTLVVPPFEELFYRSFVYRFLAAKDFLSVPLGKFLPMPFFVTSILFGFAHREWLAGILCGFAYQGLVVWKKRLGDAVTAHAITNLLLGLWIAWRGAWHFW